MITTRRRAVLSFLACSCYGQGLDFIKSHYTKYEFPIPLREGKRLFTRVYVTKDTNQMAQLRSSWLPAGGPQGRNPRKCRLVTGKGPDGMAWEDRR